MKRHTPERVALVTGAARGLGQHFAERLAEDGCRVVLVDVRDCAATAAKVVRAGSVARCMSCDLENPKAIDELVCDVLRIEKRVDILINNAAFQPPTRWESLALPVIRKMLAINTEAAFVLALSFAPGMAERRWGRIVNLVSSSAWSPPPAFSAYITTKMANVGMARGLAREFGPLGITINCLAPGLTRTEAATRDVPESVWQGVLGEQLIPRTGEPADLLGALSFLCSDDASFITGQTYHVDGGATL